APRAQAHRGLSPAGERSGRGGASGGLRRELPERSLRGKPADPHQRQPSRLRSARAGDQPRAVHRPALLRPRRARPGGGRDGPQGPGVLPEASPPAAAEGLFRPEGPQGLSGATLLPSGEAQVRGGRGFRARPVTAASDRGAPEWFAPRASLHILTRRVDARPVHRSLAATLVPTPPLPMIGT